MVVVNGGGTEETETARFGTDYVFSPLCDWDRNGGAPEFFMGRESALLDRTVVHRFRQFLVQIAPSRSRKEEDNKYI